MAESDYAQDYDGVKNHENGMVPEEDDSEEMTRPKWIVDECPLA